jgi:hypothetical protein
MSAAERKLFTLEEANKTLPLVRVIVRDLAEVSKRVVDTGCRLEHLTEGRDLATGDPYAEELAEMRSAIERDSQRVREFIDELLELGIEPDEQKAGVVDFPAEIDGEQVYLCWRYDEPEVLFWRTMTDGFDERRPLTADSLPGGSDSGSAV